MFIFFKTLYRTILRILPTRPALYIMYFRGYRKVLNLKNPKYYGEKIQWLKLYGNMEELGDYVDKYKVREYVKRTIGEQYLIGVLGLYDNIDDIDFNILPDRFVMKCTNGSQSVLICKDKSKLNIDKAKKIMKGWLDERFYRVKKEFQYKYVKNRILIEEYMEDDTGELRDYKLYCFNGEPQILCVWNGRFGNKTIDAYDMNGVFLPDFQNGSKRTKTSDEPADIRVYLEELKELSKTLSKCFTFVRTDFYIVNGRVYFGELTFSDGAGCEPMFPINKYDVAFGSSIPLEPILIEQEKRG